MKQTFLNKQILTRFGRPLVVLAVAVIGVVMLRGAAAAGNATFTLSPSSGSYANGSKITVSVSESSGEEPVNFVQANIQYDPAKLTFVGFDTAGTSFSNSVYENNGQVAGGKVSIGRFTAGGSQPATGDNKLVTKVIFQVISGSGTASLSLASDSSIVSANSNSEIWNGADVGGTFSLTTPATTPTTPTTPTTSGGGGGSSGSSSNGTASTPRAGSSGNVAATPTTPVPADQTTPLQEASAGLSNVIALVITDADGKVVAGAKVTLDKTTVLSDATGVASFTGLKAGKYKVKVSSPQGGVSKSITITSDGTGQVQRFDLKVKKGPNFLLYGAIGVIAVLAGVLLTLAKRWTKKKKDLSSKFVHVHVGGEEPKPEPANNSVATVITPSSDSDDEASVKLRSKFAATDTLEQIEQKVGAAKTKSAQPDNSFMPTLITPTKPKTTDKP